MKNFIVILNGPKGSGKSTVSALLSKKLQNTEFIGLDLMRKSIADSKPTNEYNQQAFDLILDKVNDLIKSSTNVVIDAVSATRASEIEYLAKDSSYIIYKYALIAPKDILMDRVKKRDMAKGKITDEDRFNYTYAMQQSSDLSSYKTFDTSQTNAGDIAELISAEVLSE